VEEEEKEEEDKEEKEKKKRRHATGPPGELYGTLDIEATQRFCGL
jgi:hypothetical protein